VRGTGRIGCDYVTLRGLVLLMRESLAEAAFDDDSVAVLDHFFAHTATFMMNSPAQ